ncbi:MAG TPA: hypothetical protein VNC59_04445 [Thermoanaerobaculia bacterium]|nr:hypothetical protein [Thermoanaerobaculia bacterium]
MRDERMPADPDSDADHHTDSDDPSHRDAHRDAEYTRSAEHAGTTGAPEDRNEDPETDQDAKELREERSALGAVLSSDPARRV